MSTLVKITDELKELDKLIDKAHSNGEIPQYGPCGHSVIKETVSILKEEINGIKPTDITTE